MQGSRDIGTHTIGCDQHADVCGGKEKEKQDHLQTARGKDDRAGQIDDHVGNGQYSNQHRHFLGFVLGGNLLIQKVMDVLKNRHGKSHACQ